MPLDMNPHDIKSEIRKRFGTLRAFEKEMGLSEKSVTDICRGRTSSRVEKAILSVINRPIAEFIPVKRRCLSSNEEADA